MKEVILFKNNKEIDWYDPVEKEPVVQNGKLTIIIDNGNIYEVNKETFDFYIWREK